MVTHIFLYITTIIQDKEAINLTIGGHGKHSMTVAKSDWKGGQEEGEIK